MVSGTIPRLAVAAILPDLNIDWAAAGPRWVALLPSGPTNYIAQGSCLPVDRRGNNPHHMPEDLP